MIVKLMVRINQADKASIMTGTFPKRIVPDKIISYPFPNSAFIAIKLLMMATTSTVETVIKPLLFVLTDSIAIKAVNNITSKKLINARSLKLLRLILQV